MKRRDFMIGAAAATGLAAASKGWAQGRDDDKRARMPGFTVGACAYSLPMEYCSLIS